MVGTQGVGDGTQILKLAEGATLGTTKEEIVGGTCSLTIETWKHAAQNLRTLGGCGPSDSLLASEAGGNQKWSNIRAPPDGDHPWWGRDRWFMWKHIGQ